jgi:hypothetical protein
MALRRRWVTRGQDASARCAAADVEARRCNGRRSQKQPRRVCVATASSRSSNALPRMTGPVKAGFTNFHTWLRLLAPTARIEVSQRPPRSRLRLAMRSLPPRVRAFVTYQSVRKLSEKLWRELDAAPERNPRTVYRRRHHLCSLFIAMTASTRSARLI